ncbi:MAG TPA: PKD domain-containing protein, partial [Acidimicrobiales bacterium]|nr:PKD domain-containing protein [Acidimicrobiales bacterium]
FFIAQLAAEAPVLGPIADQSVDEGGTVRVRVAGEYAASGRTLRYALGAGAPAGAFIDPLTGEVSWPAADGPADVAIPVVALDRDDPTRKAERAVRVHVANRPPTVTLGGGATVAAGAAFGRVGSFADPGNDTWTGAVDYGDGAGSQPLALRPDKTFDLLHAYSAPGAYTIRVAVTDKDGGQGWASLPVVVGPAGGGGPGGGPGGGSAPVTLQVIQLTTKKRATGAIVLIFSGPLDPGSAGDLANYQVLDPGHDRRFGTRDDKRIALKKADYDATRHAVSLRPRRRLVISRALRLIVSTGPGHLRDASGRPVDGNNDGVPGGDIVSLLQKTRGALRSLARPVGPRAQPRPFRP